MSIVSELNRLLQAKSDLAASITNKGVTVPAAATLDEYAALVDQIQGGGPTLPYVEYLESSGTQYIDTGVAGSSDLSMKLTCYYPQSSSSSTGFILGSRVANNNKQYGLIGSYTKNFRYGNNGSNDWSNPDGRVLIFDNTVSHNVLKVYDTDNTLVATLTVTASTFNNNLSVYLFANNNNGSATCASHKIYALQLYEGSTLVRDYVPVRVGQVGYMFDKVSGEFFGNAGTGSFILGPDVT